MDPEETFVPVHSRPRLQIIVFSPRPARIVREIRVPFGRPRHESMKTEPAFLELRHAIWEILKQGIRT